MNNELILNRAIEVAQQITSHLDWVYRSAEGSGARYLTDALVSKLEILANYLAQIGLASDGLHISLLGRSLHDAASEQAFTQASKDFSEAKLAEWHERYGYFPPYPKTKAERELNDSREKALLGVAYQLRSTVEDIERCLCGSQKQSPVAKPKATKRKPKATANQKMLGLLQKDRARVQGFTAQQWANELGCAKSTVAATPTWKSLATTRLADAAKRQLGSDRRRRTKRS